MLTISGARHDQFQDIIKDEDRRWSGVVQQAIVQLASAIDLATVIPGLPQQLRLPSIFPCPRAQRALLPGIKTAVQPLQQRLLQQNRVESGR